MEKLISGLFVALEQKLIGESFSEKLREERETAAIGGEREAYVSLCSRSVGAMRTHQSSFVGLISSYVSVHNRNPGN